LVSAGCETRRILAALARLPCSMIVASCSSFRGSMMSPIVPPVLGRNSVRWANDRISCCRRLDAIPLASPAIAGSTSVASPRGRGTGRKDRSVGVGDAVVLDDLAPAGRFTLDVRADGRLVPGFDAESTRCKLLLYRRILQ